MFYLNKEHENKHNAGFNITNKIKRCDILKA